MTYRLFLDDLRNPPDRSWVTCRSVAAAQEYIEAYGYPYLISFDHDLGMKTTGVAGGFIILAQEVVAPTGYDFAKWLCECDLDEPWMSRLNFRYQVHSANPVGKRNIDGYLSHYFKAVVHAGESK